MCHLAETWSLEVMGTGDLPQTSGIGSSHTGRGPKTAFPTAIPTQAHRDTQASLRAMTPPEKGCSQKEALDHPRFLRRPHWRTDLDADQCLAEKRCWGVTDSQEWPCPKDGDGRCSWGPTKSLTRGQAHSKGAPLVIGPPVCPTPCQETFCGVSLHPHTDTVGNEGSCPWKQSWRTQEAWRASLSKVGFPPTVLQAMPRSDEGTDFVIKDLEEVGGHGRTAATTRASSREMPLLCVCPTSGPTCFPSLHGDPHLASLLALFSR